MQNEKNQSLHAIVQTNIFRSFIVCIKLFSILSFDHNGMTKLNKEKTEIQG